MKELIAILFGIMLIALGWDQPYQAHFMTIKHSVAVLSPGTAPQYGAPAPAAIPRYVPRAPAPAPAPAPDKSWMWQRSTLDSPKQSGVDRSGVHTLEPLMRDHAQ